ncbi:hypothetical protein ACOMHN_006981 [Nucella lapillus]
MILTTALAACCLVMAHGYTNLLKNPGFEQPMESEWTGKASKLKVHTEDKVEGMRSLLVTERRKATSGPSQKLSGLTPGRGYELRVSVKLLQKNATKMFQHFKAVVQFKFNKKTPGKLPTCKHLKDSERKECIARRRKQQKAEMRKKKKEDKQRKKQDRRRGKEERRRKKKEQQKKQNRRGKARNRKQKGSNVGDGKYIIAWRAWITPETGWFILTGSINAPMWPFSESALRIQGPDSGLDFLIDNVTLYEIPERINWQRESRVNIDKHRKTDLHIKLNIPASIPKADIDVQVRLKKHLFAFGSKGEYKTLTKKKYKKFQDFFFNVFNWATIGSFKWRFDRGTLYEPDFSQAMEMLDTVQKHGLKVRAHSIFWGVKDNIPTTVIKTPPEDLPKLINFHTQYMMNLTKGRVQHWDVQNELLHGHWYEETLKDPNISITMFKEARKWDSVPKLYLNDFTAVTSGANTEDLHDTALRFKDAGSGIQGLGIQGHTKALVKPDPTMIWRRLDRLTDTGLELFMTEFDVGWHDDYVRADWLEDAMRAFFAHKGLGGVMLWGFWKDKQRYKNKYLLYGPDLLLAEPGHRYVCLIKKEWTTNVTRNMASNTEFSTRAFHGDYEVIIRRTGVPIQKENFSLGKNIMTVHINVTENTDPVEVTQEKDFTPECVSHRDRKSLGNVTSTSTDTKLTCVDKTASQSSVASSASNLNVTCPIGSVMTGCGSYQQSGSSMLWRGENIVIVEGVPTCSAIIPQNGTELKVSARCCQTKGLTCDYRQAGPSHFMDGAIAEAACPRGTTAAGCTASSEYSHVSGAYPISNMTACRAVNGLPVSQRPETQSGAVSGAVCCKTTSGPLSCVQVQSAPMRSGDSFVRVGCSSGQTMTACHAHAASGGTKAGSHLSSDSNGVATCKAYKDVDHPEKNSASVVAVATCCTA